MKNSKMMTNKLSVNGASKIISDHFLLLGVFHPFIRMIDFLLDGPFIKSMFILKKRT